MKIVTAEYLRSAEHKRDYLPGGLTEVAFAGRSNVGKSSAINLLLGRKGLVKTSKTPGHTRKLNFFLINDRFVFVDLPGYGFARVPLEVKRRWGPMVETYLKEREQLAGVVVIVDSRRPPTDSDMTLVDFLKSHGIPLAVAATKADKLPRGKLSALKRTIEREVGADVPVVLFSSLNGTGKKELWKEVKKLIEGKQSTGPA